MKGGIITFHFVNNYGGALQCYALQNVINEKLGIECRVINYRNPFILFTDFVRLFPVTKNPHEILSGLKTMSDRRRRLRKFKTFIENSCSLTPAAYTLHQLKRNQPEVDFCVCGSDQIWNPFLTLGVCRPYFLRFAPEGTKTISYAASFGQSSIPAVFKGHISSYIKDLDVVSIREQSGHDMIMEMTGLDVPVLIDPTFLLSKEDWQKVSAPSQEKEKYILVYMMQHDESMYERVKELKEKTGLKVVEISRYGCRSDYVNEIRTDVGPEEFLGLFLDAECVCTNSFHGLVYALIFEKNVSIVPCRRFQTRMTNLMNLLGVTQNNGDLFAAYDPEYIHNTLNQESEKSMAFLKEAIS